MQKGTRSIIIFLDANTNGPTPRLESGLENTHFSRRACVQDSKRLKEKNIKEGGNFHISRLLPSQRDFKDKHLAGPPRDKAVWISEGFSWFFFLFACFFFPINEALL